MDHTTGYYLDKAKQQWLAERSDASHLRTQLQMAQGRIMRLELLVQAILDRETYLDVDLLHQARELVEE